MDNDTQNPLEKFATQIKIAKETNTFLVMTADEAEVLWKFLNDTHADLSILIAR